MSAALTAFFAKRFSGRVSAGLVSGWVYFAVRSGRLWKVLPETSASNFRQPQAADQQQTAQQSEVARLRAVAVRPWKVDTWVNAQAEQPVQSSTKT